MKKITFILVMTLCFTGCTNTKTNDAQITNQNNSQSDIAPGYRDGDKVDEVVSSLEITLPIHDSKVMFDTFSIIALVHIDSIIGGDNYSSLNEQYVSPYTYGKMTVKQVYKGEIPVDDQLMYYRLGGTVTFDQYYKSCPIAEREKMDERIANGVVPPDYIKSEYEGNTDIKVGKDYIVYLEPETTCHGRPGEYAIGGFQGGLREVQGNLKTKSDLQVYNNFTNTWESLDSILY